MYLSKEKSRLQSVKGVQIPKANSSASDRQKLRLVVGDEHDVVLQLRVDADSAIRLRRSCHVPGGLLVLEHLLQPLTLLLYPHLQTTLHLQHQEVKTNKVRQDSW